MKSRLAVIAAAVVVVASITILLTRGPQTPAQRARAAAKDACGYGARFIDVVARNGSSETAKDLLARAIASAGKARALDMQRWLPLESGLKTIRVALEHDDAGAADVGTRVVRSNCGQFR